MSIKEASKKWGISTRRIQTLCNEGRIIGAERVGNYWTIPINAQKPSDGRCSKIERIPDVLYTSIDLFSGPGGLCTGFKWAGIKPLIAVEWSYWTVQTYAASHNADIFNLEDYLNGSMENPQNYFLPSNKTLLIYGDINKVEISLIKMILNKRFNAETVDIVTGGAPCESFSMAGDRKERDDRNMLYKNILRIAQGVNSKMLMFENVKGLFSKKYKGQAGLMYDEICRVFQSRKKGLPQYKLASSDKSEVLLKAANYGVPQARERLFLVGLNTDFPELNFSYPEKTHGENCEYNYVTVENAINDLPKIESGFENNNYNFEIEKIQDKTRIHFLRRMRGNLSMPPEHTFFNEHSLYNHKAPGHTKKILERIKLINQGEGMQSATKRLISEGKQELVDLYFPRKIYAARNRKLVPTEPSFTVTSHCLDEMLHPFANRALSPREAARLQSFPDWYQFQGPYVKFHSDPEQDLYEQIGDAIPPLLAYALGKEIVKTLKNTENKICNEKELVSEYFNL